MHTHLPLTQTQRGFGSGLGYPRVRPELKLFTTRSTQRPENAFGLGQVPPLVIYPGFVALKMPSYVTFCYHKPCGPESGCILRTVPEVVLDL